MPRPDKARQRAELQASYNSTQFAQLVRQQYEVFPMLLGQFRALEGIGDKPPAMVA